MTGGAFSPRAEAFLADVSNLRVSKPFAMGTLRAVAREYVRSADGGGDP